MRDKSIIYQTLPDRSLIIHLVKRPKKHPKGGWYRQTLALEGMLNRSLERWCDYWYDKKYDTHNSFVIFRKETPASMFRSELSPSVEHDSVWDFFEYIDYNHKDKRVSNTDTLIFFKEK